MSIAALPLLLAGCTGGPPDAEPVTFSPSPEPTGLPEGDALVAWKDSALPDVRPGEPGEIGRGAVSMEADTQINVDMTEGSGLWEVTFTCQTEDGSPLSFLLQSPSSTITDESTLECSAPGEDQFFTQTTLFEGGVAASLNVFADAGAVVAYDVRSHVEPQS